MKASTIILITVICVCVFAVFVTLLVVFSTTKKPPHHITIGPQKKISCPLDDVKKLTKCDPSDVNACTNCEQGLFTCLKVDEKNPFSIKINKKPVMVPSGNWCLPPVYVSNPCNPNSGFPILEKKNDREYDWNCQCKYPSLFNTQGVGGDCTYQVACGGPSYPLVCPEGSKFCTPGKPWIEESTYDPSVTVCKCPSGETHVERPDGTKDCLRDTCAPGGKYNKDTDKCDCDAKQGGAGTWKSFIETKDIDSDQRAQYPNQCLKDPCNPHGYYDPTQSKCVCDPNYYNTPADTVVKQVCTMPCENNGPCSKRGDCVYDPKTNKTTCANCRGGFVQDEKNQCSQLCLGKNILLNPSSTDLPPCDPANNKCCKGLGCIKHWWQDKTFCQLN